MEQDSRRIVCESSLNLIFSLSPYCEKLLVSNSFMLFMKNKEFSKCQEERTLHKEGNVDLLGISLFSTFLHC